MQFLSLSLLAFVGALTISASPLEKRADYRQLYNISNGESAASLTLSIPRPGCSPFLFSQATVLPFARSTSATVSIMFLMTSLSTSSILFADQVSSQSQLSK
jgi:hypothetical protein